MSSTVQIVLSWCQSFFEKWGLRYDCSLFKTMVLVLKKRPSTLRALPVMLWNGNAQHGYSILNGFFRVCNEQGAEFQKSWTTPEELFTVPAFFAGYLYRFELLHDLKATGDISARRLARRLIEYFFQHKVERLHREQAVFVAATRLSNLILLYDFFGTSADSTFRKTFFKGLRRDYLSLRYRFPTLLHRSGSVEERLTLVKALVEYNVYVEEDPVFFKQLLRVVWTLIRDLTQTVTQHSAATLFRMFCGLIDLRNALLQNEKTFLSRYPYYEKTFQRTFHAVQVFLQQLMPFLRFHRHSNGALCCLAGSTEERAGQNTLFFEPIPSPLIDMALSQVEANPDLPLLERNDILRQTNKRSVLFINLQQRPPKRSYRVEGYQPNVLSRIMEVEWSAQSYSVVRSSSVAFLPKSESPIAWTSTEPTFRFHKTQNGVEGLCLTPVWAFKRTVELSAKEDQLNGEDELLMNDMDESLALEAFTFGSEWEFDRILHEPPATHGEVLFRLQPSVGVLGKMKKKARQKVVCYLTVDAEAPFSLKIRSCRGTTCLTSIFLLEAGRICPIRWSIQLIKE